jgi:hypothetical protein
MRGAAIAVIRFTPFDSASPLLHVSPSTTPPPTPVPQAVLLSPVHTLLHDECVAVMALHVAPGLDIPRRASLELLYHLLGVIPAYRWGREAGRLSFQKEDERGGGGARA